METYKMYVDGAFVDAENGDCYNSINPFNGEALLKFLSLALGMLIRR